MLKNGFALVEILILLAVAALFVAIATSLFLGFQNQAINAAEQAAVGAIQTGIQAYGTNSLVKGRTPVFPRLLDYAKYFSYASGGNQFFGQVLQHQAASDKQWYKYTNAYYRSPLRNFYMYHPRWGAFFKRSSTIIAVPANAEGINLLPAEALTDYDPRLWTENNGALYTPWPGNALNFKLNFLQEGFYDFEIFALNNPNLAFSTYRLGQVPRNNWQLPSDYDKFYLDVVLDGVKVSPQGFAIIASDNAVHSNRFCTHVSEGNHTLSITWLNDQWDAQKQEDANFQLQEITILGRPNE